MANIREFTITKHATDRLRERNPNFAKEVDWIPSAALKKKATYDFLHSAKEEKSFLNNSVFMTMLGEKYGFENRYSLFVRENYVFVGISNENGNFIVTTLLRDQHVVPHVRNSTVKFRKRSKVH